MAIRDTIELDTRNYLAKLNEADRAAIKGADRREKSYKKASQQMGALENDIRKLKQARDASNSTGSIQRYNKAIQSLEKEYNDLEREVKEYGNAVQQSNEKATKSTKKLETEQKGVSKGFAKMGSAAKMWLGGAVMGVIFAAQQALRELSKEQLAFDKNFNESIAIQQTNGASISVDQQEKMKRAARETSRELNISTDKVAKGYFYLASAGLNVEQQIANIGVVAKFAKAGQFDLALATDLLTDAQSALGLTTEDAVKNQENMIRVSDVLSKANTIANASIQQFSESLTNKAGTALRNYNKEVEEGVAILAVYADKGVKDRLAGERLNILLKRLSDSAINNAEAFDENNIAVFDADEKFRNVADIIYDLEQNLDGLTDKQRAARLAQLGFTAETQDAILPLIGLSGAIKNYESALKDAGGTTDRIAKNQLKNLQDRIGLMFRKLNDTFGPGLLSWLEKSVGLAEDLVDRFDKLMSDDLDVLIRNLKEFGGNEELIMKLEFQNDMNKTKELRDRIAKELEELEVPVNIVSKGGIEKTVDVLASQLKSVYKSIKDAASLDLSIPLANQIKLIDEAWQNFEFTTTDFDITKLDDYKNRLVIIEESWLEMNNLALELNKQGADTSSITEKSDKLLEQMNIYSKMIAKGDTLLLLDKKIGKQKANLAQGNYESIGEGGSGTSTAEEIGLQEQAIEDATQALEQYRKDIAELKIQLNAGSITQDVFDSNSTSKAEAYKNELIAIFSRVKESGQELSDELREALSSAFSLLPDAKQGLDNDLNDKSEAFKRLDNLITGYNRTLNALQNTYQSGGFNFTEEQLFEESTREAEAFQKQLKALYVELVLIGELTPELENMFSTLWEKPNKKAKKLNSTFDDIADAASGILSVADAFGDLDDSLKNVLRGGIDVLKNLQNIKDLDGKGLLGLAGTGLAGAIPAIGLIGGVATMISGLFNKSSNTDRSKEEFNELKNSVADQISALKENTNAILDSTIIGGDRTRGELQDLYYQFNALKVFMNDDGNDNSWTESLMTRIQNALLSLERSDAELFEGANDMFLNFIIGGFTEKEALNRIINLFGTGIEDLINNFGNYSNSLQGTITKFQDSINLGLVPLQEAFDTLVQDLKNLGLNLGNEFYRAFISEGDVSGFVEDLIKELSSSETSDERRDEIIAALFNNQDSLRGDLTPEEFKELLNFLKGIDPDAGFTGGSGVSRSVAVSSSITEFQANEVVVWLQALNYNADEQLAIQKSQLFELSRIATETLSPEPNPMPSMSSTNNISVSVNGSLNDTDISNITDQIARELKTYAK